MPSPGSGHDASAVNLIVPISLEALCVGQREYGRNLVEAAYDFSLLPPKYPKVPNVGEQVGSNLFSNSHTPEPGVHLHWALPKALSHGSGDGNGNRDVDFPEVPNRWLLMRILTDASVPDKPVVSSKAWVVESDYLSMEDPGQSPTIPGYIVADSAPAPGCYYLGKVFDAASWQEGQESSAKRFPKFTALGYGDPSFAAFYPNCRNVFGMWDNLADAGERNWEKVKLAYCVAGWYSRREDDPVQKSGGRNLAGDWKWAIAGSQEQAQPKRTLCCGTLAGIDWRPDREYLDRGAPTDLQVAVGNTAMEALSALLAQNPEAVGTQAVEKVLNALQLGILPQLMEADGKALYASALHQSAFGSAGGGTVWGIEKADAEDADDDFELPDMLAGELGRLNAGQRDYDFLQEQIQSERWQIYADWYKYMLAEHQTDSKQKDPAQPDDVMDVYKLVHSQIEALQEKIKKSIADADNLSAQARDLKLKLPAGYALKPTAGPRYWQANEPVVLLYGQDAMPMNRRSSWASENEDGNLLCRVSGQVVSELQVEVYLKRMTLKGKAVAASPVNPAWEFASDLQALFWETLLLDDNQAGVLAKALLAAGSRAPFESAVNAVRDAQKAVWSEGIAGKSGRLAPAPIAWKAWEQGKLWLPVFLHWRVKYYPLQRISEAADSVYAPDFIQANYVLDVDAVDYRYRGAEPASLQEYQGSIVLNPQAAINLKRQIRDYVAHYPEDPRQAELAELLKVLDKSPILHQALSGFNLSLLMRRQTFQLKIGDPCAPGRRLSDFSNIIVPAAVQDANTSAPMLNNEFNPLRAGFARLDALRVVDTFGQFRDIQPQTVARAETMICPAAPAEHARDLYLPPRIAQPCRLLFRFLSSQDSQMEMNDHPATTPVCGWVLANHLDQSVMVYAAGGKALGELILARKRTAVTWLSAPGSGVEEREDKKAEIEETFKNENQDLKAFVLGILGNDAGFFAEFMRTIDLAFCGIAPDGAEQGKGLALMMGRPLALAAAVLRLELQGVPAARQDWTGINPKLNPKYPKKNTAQFEGVKVQVRVGDAGRANDGLVGYFLCDGQIADYQTWYAPAATGKNPHIRTPQEDTITLTCCVDATTARDQKLVMLLDPRAKVNATCGIVPVKTIEIPPVQYSRFLRDLAVTFLTSPVLYPNDTAAMALPEIQGTAWSWVERNNNGTWNPEAAINKVNDRALINYSHLGVHEGWMKLRLGEKKKTMKRELA